jgi:hypothetical protein
MTAGTPADALPISGSTPLEFSPVTEFLNGATDQLYVSGLSSTVSPNFLEFLISTFPGSPDNATTEANGTTGIVVDNVGTGGQESSMYFGTVGTNTAVKLTQAGLN